LNAVEGIADGLGTRPSRLAPLIAKQAVKEQPRVYRCAVLRKQRVHPSLRSDPDILVISESW
jgi:hypothetical protein